MNRYLLIGLVLIGASLALARQEESPAPAGPDATPSPNAGPQVQQAAPFPNAGPQLPQAGPAGEAEAPEAMPPPGTNDLAEPSEPGSNKGSDDTADEARGSGGPQGSTRRDGRESRKRRLERERQRSRSSQGNARAGSDSATNAVLNLDYSAFKIINDLNIFDPNRRPSGPRPQERPPPSEYFGLVGTMHYEKGTFAWFSGSDSKYEKVLKVSDSIAGYKVTDIDSDSVKLIPPAPTTSTAARLTTTNGAAGAGATNSVAGLAITNGGARLPATNSVAGLAITNGGARLPATNSVARLVITQAVAGPGATNGGVTLAKAPAPPTEVVMRMGMQLRRRGDEPWRLSEGSSEESYSPSSRSSPRFPSSGANGAASSGSGPASAGGESDILKRLMQRREKE